MGDSNELTLAQEGDAVNGDDLQTSIDHLRGMADDLNTFFDDPNVAVDDIQAVGRAQQQLRGQAGAFAGAQIDLLVEQLKVTADHINRAISYSRDVISEVADLRRRLGMISAVLAFATVVLTGKGNDILKAARNLKSALDA